VTPARQATIELLCELDDIEPAQRADAAKIAMATLLSVLAPADRQDAVDFIAWRNRKDLS
jgi:hypothetical protein